MTTAKLPTLFDVAALAQVSHQTVSRVINEHPNVSAKTRQRVAAAIEQLGYQPNRAARSLATGRAQTIQIIVLNPFFYRPLQFLVQEIETHGFFAGMSNLYHPLTVEAVRQRLSELVSRAVDGFIFFDPQFELSDAELSDMCHGKPYVMMGGKTAPAMPAVVGDQRQGVRQAIAHLLALGHRRFAKIAGPTDNEDACTRHAAYLEMLAENGLEAGPTTHSNFMADGGYACAMDLIGESTAADLPPFTALVCDNDDSALGALRALHERGIRIPYDVSVVGYDNVANAPYYEPPLTTVDQNDRVWSHQTVAYLLALIENPHTERTCQRFSPQLIVRHSTQAALR